MKTMIMTFLVVYTMITPKEFKGTVTNINNNEKLSGVMIVANKIDTTYTDLNGDFKLKNDNGINNLEFNYLYYTTKDYILVKDSSEIQIVKPNTNVCMKK